MGSKVEIPALRPQKPQVVERGFGPGQNHQIRVTRQRIARLYELDRHVRLPDQWVQVVKIRDPWQHRHHHANARIGGGEGVLSH